MIPILFVMKYTVTEIALLMVTDGTDDTDNSTYVLMMADLVPCIGDLKGSCRDETMYGGGPSPEY
jgi:hypothetical protein